MRVYIAGRISGDPSYRTAFNLAEWRLSSEGHAVLNPAKLPGEGFHYDQYIRIGFAMLKECEAIYMLRGWEDSAGARQEHDYARQVGMKIMYEEEHMDGEGKDR